ncbi:hypothetical protein [Methylocystis sp. S23]
MNHRSDIIDLDLHFHHETEKAILVSENGIRDAGQWLPKSRIEFERRADGSVVVSLPEWLAEEKGLM